MKTILVSGATGIVGYGCLRSLRLNKELVLIGTSIHEPLIASTVCNKFVKALHTDDKNYITWLVSIIRKYHIDLLIPGIEIDMYSWNQNREIIEQTGAKLMLNASALIHLCGDKWKFYKRLNKVFPVLSIPTSMETKYDILYEQLKTPFLLKPKRGFAAKGIVIVENKEDFNFYKNKFQDTIMAQKILKGDEYTIGAFFDRHSNLCAHISMKRNLNVGGFTDFVEVVELKEIEKTLVILAEIFKPVGATNFQFIEEDGQLKLLEINPRISSSTSLRTAFNYNECLMSVEFFLHDIVPSQPQITFGKASRYIEDFINYDRINI